MLTLGGSIIGALVKNPNVIRGLNVLAGLGIASFGLMDLVGNR